MLYIQFKSVMKKFLVLFMFLFSCSQNKINQDFIINNFDINKYLGTWYEIARIDNWFEKNLINVKAEYSLNENKLNIINSGYDTKSNKEKTINGVGYLVRDNYGQLKISFFRPFYSEYNIIILDKDYNYAVVAGNNYNYLWILTRNKSISNKLYDNLKQKISNMGFDVNKLINVSQE